MDGVGARGRGVSGRVRRRQALQFGCSLSARPVGGKTSARDRRAVHRLVADCDRGPGCALRDRIQGARLRQGRRNRGLSVAVGVSRPDAGLCRRRYDRRKRVRARRSAWRLRLFGRQDGARARSACSQSRRRSAIGSPSSPIAATTHDRAPPNQEPEPRSGADRQFVHGGPRRPQRPHRLVVLPLFRFRSGVLATCSPTTRRKGSAKSR